MIKIGDLRLGRPVLTFIDLRLGRWVNMGIDFKKNKIIWAKNKITIGGIKYLKNIIIGK